MSETHFHLMPDGRRIAFRHTQGRGPAIVFLPGYLSDMAGSKAEAVYQWAQQTGRACLLLDYSGCGLSDGAFAEGTLSRWRDEVLALIAARLGPAGEVLLIGSSMGGWLMLLIAQALGSRVAGMIGIAAAPDFTQWSLSDTQKRSLTNGQTVFEDNPYGPAPTPTHPEFYADSLAHLWLEREPALDMPVVLVHGQRDTDVPWELSVRLAAALRSDRVQVVLVKDGDHRLSRAQDIALLLRTIAAFDDKNGAVLP